MERAVETGSTLQIQTQSQLQSELGVKQYEGTTDNLVAEFSVLKHLTTMTAADMPEVHMKEEEAYDVQYNSTHPPAHFMAPKDCSQAPDCDRLNRKRCYATNNTCGPCKREFFGSPGDSNEPCSLISCTEAPDCDQLNRQPCGSHLPNTCGPCFTDFRVANTTWTPDKDDDEPGNDMCLAVNFRPVVFVHGLGDTYHGLAANIPAHMTRRTFHVLRTFNAEPGGAVFSMAKPFAQMVEDFTNEVRSIPSLKRGFNLVGISQGGLIARAYVEKYNDPPVYNFVSLHAPQSGIAKCPGDASVAAMPCKAAIHLGLITPHDYWRGPDSEGVHTKATYLSWNNYLSDINNESGDRNATYRDNMLSLQRYILVKAERDRTVIPAESEWHGYFEWGNLNSVVEMENTDEYRDDVIGLKTLNEEGRLIKLSTAGGHLRLPPDFFQRYLYQFFDNGWLQDGSTFDLGSYYQAAAATARAQ